MLTGIVVWSEYQKDALNKVLPERFKAVVPWHVYGYRFLDIFVTHPTPDELQRSGFNDSMRDSLKCRLAPGGKLIYL